MNDIILKKFNKPDEIRNFTKGKFEIVKISDMIIGKATYEPGWKWSVDVSPLSGTEFCEVEHLGMVLSGSATVAFKEGKIHIFKKRRYILRRAQHHMMRWVVGNNDYVIATFYWCRYKCTN